MISDCYSILSWCFYITIYYTPNIHLLNDNSQPRVHHFVSKALLLLPMCITLHLYTLNFICHFISQPFSLVQSFCKSLQSAFILLTQASSCHQQKFVSSLSTPQRLVHFPGVFRQLSQGHSTKQKRDKLVYLSFPTRIICPLCFQSFLLSFV